ncbi:hypothetical protein CISG_00446 [Coccidioides immitis RMSCC 3703]|uniref:Uncharacterized protein n=1 Tax=Coccidioides immitis RMSCC 3703 TaxID=454286 RepID=A0A0J8TEY8_COCIT|nr:hypothetical protein CISG_00446 [Coccidioides immitis RMSCC 3703]
MPYLLMMPSPGIPHRPSNRGSAKNPASKPKRLDLGDPLGPYDTNTVREKVRKWQQQGGGVVIAPDVGASDDGDGDGDGEGDRSSKESGLAARQKRKDRSGQEGAGKQRMREPEEGEKQKISNRTIGTAPKKTGDMKETKEKFEKRTEKYGKPTSGDGIKVYAGPLREPKSPGARRSDGSERSNSSTDHKNKYHGRDTKKSPSRHRSTRREVKAKYIVNDFPYKSDHSKPNESSEAASLSGGFINQVVGEPKKKFSKKDLPPVQQSHGSKVEAWLSRTSDPFVSDHEPYVEIPAPLKSSPRRSDSGNEKDSDPNRHSRLEGHRSSTKRKSRTLHRHQERFSGTDEDDHQKEPSSTRNDRTESSPPNLKRSKASRRPESMENRRMSMLHESIEEAIQASAVFDRPVSSDGSEGSSAERPPPLTLRRLFPGTGMHRLSTIASVDTLDTATEPSGEPTKNMNKLPAALEHDDVSESETRDQFDPNSIPGPGARSLKRKLTTHSDLMSVLSLPAGGSRSIRSARSIRTNRSRLATATVGDIMRELASDEGKYMRELRTLVGGVIPVLLTSVLSKADSAVAAGLFRPSAKPTDEDSFTRPIVNMGVSLEKLKSIHKRIPLEDPEALLAWAQGAQKVYADYLSAWRLGFQDVVVNLAPPDPDELSKGPNSDAQSLYAGMSQDENGDVIDGDGERVDVAYLLKRPLVRLKYLAKTFKGLNYIQSSPKTKEIQDKYQSLVTDARRRANEERARLEDEAANAIDTSRARDIHTLAVLKNVEAKSSRRVRARDFFDLSFLHTTGQQIDCRTELLLRDNATEDGPGGDLFICEVDSAGRWLLFPPIDHGRVSARNGDSKGEIVIMVRGVPEEGGNWYELLALKTEDEQIGFEWVQMLGLSPVPPKINRSMSFVNRAKQKKVHPQIDLKRSESVVSTRSIIPSPTDIGVPIGENALRFKSQIEDDRAANAALQVSRDSTSLESSRNASTVQKTAGYDPRTPPALDTVVRTPRCLNEAMEMAGGASPTTLKRSKAKRRSKYGPLSPSSPISSEDARTPEQDVKPAIASPEPEPQARKRNSELLARSVSPELKDFRAMRRAEKGQRPIAEVTRLGRRSVSPVPSLDLPSIPRLRKRTPIETPPSPPVHAADSSPVSSRPKTPKKRDESAEEPFLRNVPVPPPHRSPSPSRSKQSSLSAATPTFSPWARHRRTSSPLKHEYEPSTATESTESTTSTNARGPYSNQPAPLSRYNSTRSSKGGGWFSWYGGSSKSSYRATSAPAPSVAGVTESSVGTMASAFSALKRFGAGSKMFSIAKSTLTSRTGSRGGSLYSTSTRSGSNSFPAGPPNGKGQEQSKLAAGGIGLTNAKIRLYCRESASKWRDMGAARLTILPASPAASPPGTSYKSARDSSGALENETGADGATATSPPASAALHTATLPSRQHEKRILIHGKAYGQVLLDVCLGESCFERVARTGIAVSVWEDFQGVAKEGGVVGGSFKIYMIQMKSEAETAYTFGLVGKLRY